MDVDKALVATRGTILRSHYFFDLRLCSIQRTAHITFDQGVGDFRLKDQRDLRIFRGHRTRQRAQENGLLLLKKWLGFRQFRLIEDCLPGRCKTLSCRKMELRFRSR